MKSELCLVLSYRIKYTGDDKKVVVVVCWAVSMGGCVISAIICHQVASIIRPIWGCEDKCAVSLASRTLEYFLSFNSFVF